MPTIILSKKDIETVSTIIAEKAMEMHKKGAMWNRGEEYLSCVDMGKMANKIRKSTGNYFDFESVFGGKKKKSTKKLKN